MNPRAAGRTSTFTAPVGVVAGTSYVASYFAPNGHYSATQPVLRGSYANGALAATGSNGRYRYGSAIGLPDQHLRRDELLGRPDLHAGHARGRDAPDRESR